MSLQSSFGKRPGYDDTQLSPRAKRIIVVTAVLVFLTLLTAAGSGPWVIPAIATVLYILGEILTYRYQKRE